MARLLAGPMGLGGSGIERSGGGSMAVAEVTVALGIWSEVRLSQDCCAEARAGTNANPARLTKNTNGMRRCRMRKPPRVFQIENAARDVYTAHAAARKSAISGDEV
jgi:hypothetical protein